ncbi:hypothetical protein GE09DRAFT_1064710 [Coniochaeta sp. 2T2.1]|nr:hypothetical protein GE09DRAFT_1064710 [Coniochaeta sp. 2T2.1]
MSALGRFAGPRPETNSSQRKPLPDARRPGEAAARQMTAVEYAPAPLEEAMADLHALDLRLRRQLEQDKMRMNMISPRRDTLASKMSVSNITNPSQESSTPPPYTRPITY